MRPDSWPPSSASLFTKPRTALQNVLFLFPSAVQSLLGWGETVGAFAE